MSRWALWIERKLREYAREQGLQVTPMTGEPDAGLQLLFTLDFALDNAPPLIRVKVHFDGSWEGVYTIRAYESERRLERLEEVRIEQFGPGVEGQLKLFVDEIVQRLQRLEGAGER